MCTTYTCGHSTSFETLDHPPCSPIVYAHPDNLDYLIVEWVGVKYTVDKNDVGLFFCEDVKILDYEVK